MNAPAPPYRPHRGPRRGALQSLAHALSKPWRRGRIARSPDRAVLVQQILPAVADLGGTVLWVGVRQYTAGYPALLERGGGVCWTTDIDPRVARWGRGGRHVTGDVRGIDGRFPAGAFEAVLCNGVFGWGVDTIEMQRATLAALRRVLAPGGLLLLGWNRGRSEDPAGLAAAAGFAPCGFAGLPPHLPIAGVTHVYQFYRRA